LDIHKPKPWRGFREFLKEYLIIVVGVLTALAAEAVVEAAHTAQKAAETEQLVREEFARNLAFAKDRVLLSACNRELYRAIERALITTPPDRPVPRFPYIWFYSRPFGWSQWEAAVASGVADHFPADRRRGYLRMYISQGSAGSFNVIETHELEVAATLRTLRMPARKLEPAVREQLLQAVAQGDWQEEWILHNAANVIAAGEALHLPAYKPSPRARLMTPADGKACVAKVLAEEAGLPPLPADQ